MSIGSEFAYGFGCDLKKSGVASHRGDDRSIATALGTQYEAGPGSSLGPQPQLA